MGHDRLFKLLLATFFVEFIELFLPEVAKVLDRRSLQFLDKEIFTDIGAGVRHEVDLVVKARLRHLRAFFLIHIENQALSQKEFARRMFEYFALLHKKYRLPVLPVAILSYDRPFRPEPDRYEVDVPGLRVLDFAFRTIQLNRLDWRDFIRKPNPIASALMAKMRIAPKDRPRVKLECLRMLATLKLDKARSALIGTFMDSYLKLTSAEAEVYNRQLAATEPKQRGRIMQMTNSWVEKGRAKGLAEGRAQGRRDIVIRLLRRRLGRLPGGLTERINGLSNSQVDELGDSILDFKDTVDATRWLDTHPPTQAKPPMKRQSQRIGPRN